MYEWQYVLSDKNNICDCFRSNQMPLTDQIKEIVPYVCIYFWVTIYYNLTHKSIIDCTRTSPTTKMTKSIEIETQRQFRDEREWDGHVMKIPGGSSAYMEHQLNVDCTWVRESEIFHETYDMRGPLSSDCMWYLVLIMYVLYVTVTLKYNYCI